MRTAMGRACHAILWISLFATYVRGQTLYWAAPRVSPPYGLEVYRSAPDGTRVELLLGPISISQTWYTSGFDLHPGRGLMFWFDRWEARLNAAQLDGAEPHTILLGEHGVNLRVDRAEDRLYWLSQPEWILKQSKIDGSDVEELRPIPPPEFGWPTTRYDIDTADRRVFRGSWFDVWSLPFDDMSEDRFLAGAKEDVDWWEEARAHRNSQFLFAVRARALMNPQGSDPVGYQLITTRRNGTPLNTLYNFVEQWPDITFFPETLLDYVYIMQNGKILRVPFLGGVPETLLPEPDELFQRAFLLGLDPRRDGDFNGDNNVELLDFNRFLTCFTGGPRPLDDPPCVFFDAHPSDRRMDLYDFASLQNAFQRL